MTASGVYDRLDAGLRKYVDALVDHAQSALWPERKTALMSFWRGIAKGRPDDLKAVLIGLGLADIPEDRLAETVFRIVLTAYLERLGEREITNPDQAALFCLSLDAQHVEEAERWLGGHPEHQVG